MANSLLQEATENTTLMSEVAAAVTSADSSVELENVADVQTFAAKVAADSALSASLESALSSLAQENGLTFAKEAAQAVTDAELQNAVTAYEVPVGTPIALLFVSAALIYMPSILAVKAEYIPPS